MKQLQGYRVSAKPKKKKTKKRKLLYKKPWWKVWTDKKIFVEEGKRYVWYYTQKWTHNSNVLYYTDECNWVVLIYFVGKFGLGISLTYHIFRHASTLKALRAKLSDVKLKNDLIPSDGKDVIMKSFKKLLSVKTKANKPKHKPVKVRL